MTIWFIAAATVLIVELFTGTVYLLVVSAALFGAGLADRLTDSTGISIMTAAVLSALGIWLVHGKLKQRSRLRAQEAAADDLDIGQSVQVVRHLHGDMYEVSYRGTRWQAQASQQPFQTASTAVITGKNGNILLIQPL